MTTLFTRFPQLSLPHNKSLHLLGKGNCAADPPSNAQINQHNRCLERTEQKNSSDCSRNAQLQPTILGLSETRWTQTGQMKFSSGELLLHFSHESDKCPCWNNDIENSNQITDRVGTNQIKDHYCQIPHKNTEGYSRAMPRSNKRCRLGNQGFILHSPISFE